jgi:hypothetical protein
MIISSCYTPAGWTASFRSFVADRKRCWHTARCSLADEQPVINPA